MGVLVRDPELLLLPLLAMTIYAIEFVAYLYLMIHFGPRSQEFVIVSTSLFLVFVGYAIAVFLSAATAYSAYQRLDGQNPTLRESLAAAWASRGGLLLWASRDAVPGLLFGRRRPARLSRGVRALVLPILVLERVGVPKAIQDARELTGDEGNGSGFMQDAGRAWIAWITAMLFILVLIAALFVGSSVLPGLLGVSETQGILIAVGASAFLYAYTVGLVGIIHSVHRGTVYHQLIHMGQGSSRPAREASR